MKLEIDITNTTKDKLDKMKFYFQQDMIPVSYDYCISQAVNFWVNHYLKYN